MSIDISNMSTEEIKEYKEKIRQKAYEFEMNRLKKINRSNKKVTMGLGVLSSILLVLLILLWMYQTKPEKIFETKTELITVHDTIYIPADTIFIEKIIPGKIEKRKLTSYYTIQVGAYRKLEMPEFLTEVDTDFPILQFQKNGLNCVSFGKFIDKNEVETANAYLKKLGFKNTVVVKIDE